MWLLLNYRCYQCGRKTQSSLQKKKKKGKPCIMDVTEYSFLNDDALLCCRGCLATDRRLFNIHDYKLADALAHFTGTPFVKDELPQHMCSYCCRLLLKCESFRDMCLHTQRSLTTELLKGKLDIDGIRKINRPFNQYLDLTLCENNLVEYIYQDDPAIDGAEIKIIKKEPETKNVNEKPKIKIVDIDNIMKQTDSKSELEAKKRSAKISVDKLKCNKNRVIKAEMPVECVNDENDDISVVETEIKTEIDIEGNKYEIYSENIKAEETESDDNDEINISEVIKTPLKRRQVKVKNTGLKRKKIGTKIAEKSINDNRPTKLREVTSKKRKRQMQQAENKYLAELDFATFESKYAVKIVTLTKEEQLEEIAARKKSRNYLESQFKCEECGKGFGVEAAYKNHVMRHNPVEGKFPCEICGIRYKDGGAQRRHQKVHYLKLMCNECDFVSRDRSTARKHHAMHAGKTYQCPHCDKSFKKSTTYLSHVRLAHPTLNLDCNLCGESFVGQKGLRMHKKRAHPEKPPQVKCTVCSANFNSIEALNRHTDTAGEHKELRPCEQCGENCASETELQEHVKEKHPNETYNCADCGLTFPSAAARDVHHQRKHVVRRKRCPVNTANKSLVCEQCGHIAKSPILLQYHQRLHEGVNPFACNLCPKTFRLNAFLELHLRTHTGEKPYQCAECPLSFSLKGNLNRHQKTAHQGIRENVPCSICGRTFSVKSALRTHVNTVHLGQPGPKRDRSKKRGSRKPGLLLTYSDTSNSCGGIVNMK